MSRWKWERKERMGMKEGEGEEDGIDERGEGR